MFQAAKLLIIDLDGTLVDTKADIAFALNSTLASFSLPPVPIEIIAEHVGSGITPLIHERVEAAEVPEFLRRFEKEYLTHIADASKPYPGWSELLPRLSDRKLFVLTNKNQKFTDALLSALELKPYFLAAYGRDAFAERKPSALPVLAILRKESVRPEEALMVGDMPADIESGQNAGTNTCAVFFGYGKKNRLIELNPTATVESVSELGTLLGVSS